MFIKLSYDLSIDTPLFLDNPPVKISPYSLIKGKEESNAYMIEALNHVGTHIDGPRHFFDWKPALAEFDINTFIFNPSILIEIQKREGELIEEKDFDKHYRLIKKADFLIVQTGLSSIRKTDPQKYSQRNPGFSASAGEYLIKNCPRLRGIGMDLPSASSATDLKAGTEFHRIMLGGNKTKRHIFLVEDMDLRNYNSNIRRIFVIPLLIQDIDSTWCTVLGEVA